MLQPLPIQDRRLVVVQRNPVSGSGQGRDALLQCISELRNDNIQVRMFRSRQSLDGYVQQPRVARRLRCIVSAGGDGTLTDLMNRHPDVPLAILPMGTENLVARYVGIERNGQAVASMIRKGRTVLFDAAAANERSFLVMLSAGADAEVVRRVHEGRHGHISRLQYAWPVFSTLVTAESHVIRAESGDGKHVAVGGHVIVTNIPAYGFGFTFSPDARPDDGLLDVRVLLPTSRIRVMSHVMQMRVMPAMAEKDVVRFRCQQLTLTAENPSNALPVQADGDPFPSLPVSIRIQPARLRLLVPDSFTAGSETDC
jgi:diacylglycerol kinase family enzyme